MTPKMHISWHNFHRDTRALGTRLREHQGAFDGIVAVARGGLVPAAILAQDFAIRHIETLCLQSYDDASCEQSSLSVLKSLSLPNGGDRWLVIDDLVDSGKTTHHARQILPNAHFACIYAKPLGRERVDTYLKDVTQETWIVFPWEEERFEKL